MDVDAIEPRSEDLGYVALDHGRRARRNRSANQTRIGDGVMRRAKRPLDHSPAAESTAPATE
jgi:hypothetical protein